MPVGQIEIVPEALLAAAAALEKFARPDLDQVTDKFASSYRVDPPGWSIILSGFEAQFNAVGDYQVKNLRAGSEAIGAVAAGLRKTVDNYNRAEKANVEMFLGSPSQDGEGLGAGWLDTGAVRAFTQGFTDNIPEIVDVGAQIALVTLACATSTMTEPYWVTATTAALMIANAVSMFECAQALNAADKMFTDHAKKSYDTYTGDATKGWNDNSVIEYQRVIAELGGELDDAEKAIASMAGALMTVLGLLAAFWIAFMAFNIPFFQFILNLTIAAVGPQALVIEPVIQSLGALASASWLTATGTVVTVVAACATMLFGVLKEFGGVQTFDKQGDSTPDIRQIKIAWHSA
jgi:hypothetical protein